MSLHKYVLYGATLTIGSNVLSNFVMLEEKNPEPVDVHLQKLMQVLEKYTDNPAFVYKAVTKNGESYIIVLERLPITETNEERSDVMVKQYATFRGNAFRTIAIVNSMNPNKTLNTITNHEETKTIYTVNQIVVPDGYNKDISKVCCKGIHFFKDLKAAYYYNLPLLSFTGKHIHYFHNGCKRAEYTYVNGKLSGKVITYYENCNIADVEEYIDGKRYGKTTKYYKNGGKRVEYRFINDIPCRPAIYWSPEGKLLSVEDKLHPAKY